MKEALKRTGRRQSIKDQITELIRREKLKPGDQILSQLRLARLLHTTEVTVHRALQDLAQEGAVHRVKGKGTYVGPAAVEGRGDALALILPGEHLDDPEHNPEYWPYVQTILRAFIGFSGIEWSFSPCAVTSKESARVLAGRLRGTAAFFLHTGDPWGLFDRLLRERLAPVVCFGLPDPERPCLTVDHDRVGGARLGVSYLAGLGYRRIGYIGSGQFWGEMSFQGYRMGLDDADLPVDPKLVARIGEMRADGARGIKTLLARAPDCDAVLVDSDLRALGVLDHLQQAGVRVPDDIGVIGYDGLDRASYQPPHLTTVRIPWRRMIETALEELARCEGPVAPVKHVSVLGDVLAGKTTRPGSEGRS